MKRAHRVQNIGENRLLWRCIPKAVFVVVANVVQSLCRPVPLTDVRCFQDDYDYWKEKICYRHRFLLVGSDCLQLSSYPVRKKRYTIVAALSCFLNPRPYEVGAWKLRRREQRRRVSYRSLLLSSLLPSICKKNETNKKALARKLLLDLCFFNDEALSQLLEEKQHKICCYHSLFFFVTNH